MILATLNAAIQERDQENELDFRLREVWGKSAAALIDMVANQIETVSYALNSRSSQPGLEITLRVEAVRNSPLDDWLSRQRNSRSGVVRHVHPRATTTCLVNFALPDVLVQTLPPLANAAALELQESALVSASGAREISTTVSNLVAFGNLELLMQFIPDGRGRNCLIVCAPLRDSPDFSSAAIELVSMVQDGSMQVSHADIDGWPVHNYAIDQDSFLPGADSLQFVVTEDLAAAFIGPVESADVLTDIVRVNFDHPPAIDALRRRGFVFQTELIDLLRILDEPDGSFQIYTGKLDQATVAVEDSITVTMNQEPHTLELSATFDRCAAVFGMTMFFGWVEAVVGGL